MPRTMLPWKLLPAFVASRAGSPWPPRWKRNAVIVSTARPSRRFVPEKELAGKGVDR